MWVEQGHSVSFGERAELRRMVDSHNEGHGREGDDEVGSVEDREDDDCEDCAVRFKR